MISHLIKIYAACKFSQLFSSLVLKELIYFYFANGNTRVAVTLEGVSIYRIKHGFSCINVCQVPREVLKTEAEGRGFQHLPRDLANVYVLENNV